MQSASFVLALAMAISANAACLPGCGIPACLPKHRVLLDNCGPNVAPLPVINAPTQVAPVVDRGTIPLPSAIPAAQTIRNVCRCLKTVVKPQVYQQVVAVPSVQRYLQTSHTPVVENINYEGIPVNCPPSTPDALQAGYIDVAPGYGAGVYGAGYGAGVYGAGYGAGLGGVYGAGLGGVYGAGLGLGCGVPACAPVLPAVPACAPVLGGCAPACF